MASTEWAAGRLAVSRTSWAEALMTALAVAQAVVVILVPAAPVIALGVWWNSNTISHNFLHRPFFRSRAANALFAAYLSALLGIPQSLWRDKHLAHHAGVRPRVRVSSELLFQVALVLAVWMALAARAPGFFLRAYLPGYLAGLGLCALHGYYEHARGVTSHYGAPYNLLAFNDGYHAEHHANPAAHWSSLPRRVEPGAQTSAWPAPLRWMEAFSLEGLERVVLRSPRLQRFVLRVHARAFRQLVGELGPIDRVAIVGGGVFPRTALIVESLLPAARIAIVDSNLANLDRARRWLRSREEIGWQAGRPLGPPAPRVCKSFGSKVGQTLSSANPTKRPVFSQRLTRGAERTEFIHAHYAPSDEMACDLLVIPLSLRGDREAVYARPPAPAVVVHDWIWRRRGASRVVSFLLLKRINLVRP